MDLGKALKTLDDSDSILLMIDSKDLHAAIPILVRELLSRDRYGLYISLNKPHTTIRHMLLRAGVKVSRLYFVDCVTAIAHKTLTKREERVIYSSGPHDVAEDGTIPQAVNSFNKSVPGEKFLILDALRTLFIYNEPKTVSLFIHSLLALTKEHELKLVVLTRIEDSPIIGLVAKAFDEVVEV
ncbi:MAG: hypothetical protein V1875_01675 [Candidatus Altiarchaeota archaeon]